ncbi:energy transducer TonB [Spirosoma aerophilum]
MTSRQLKAACILSLLLSFFLSTGYAQLSTDRIDVELDPAPVPDQAIPPEFPGGTSAMETYLKKHVRYPASAAQANVKGFVLVSFRVDTLGNLTAIRVSKSIGYGCEEEALRVVTQMPRWKPSYQSGKAVPANYGLPVRFPPSR